LEGNAGRREILDYQHDASAGWLVVFEDPLTNMNQSPQTTDPHFLILGLGETGVAAARWCVKQGWRVRVADTRTAPGGLSQLQRSCPDAAIDYRLGCETLEPSLLEGISQLVLSPGLSPYQSPTIELLQAARSANIPVIGEIELFAQALHGLKQTVGYQPKVLGITGTNGKTTVTALTQHMLEGSGIRARAAGNISPAALDALMSAIDEDALPDVWVLELSSFQLETVHSLRFAAAVVLNVTQDHLDWHGDMVSYVAAKQRIYQSAELSIVNRDDSTVMQMCAQPEGVNVRSFGRSAPTLSGDLGLETSHGVHWLVKCEPNEFDNEHAPGPKRKKDAVAPSRPAGRIVRMMPAEALTVKGLHNALNCEAALLLAHAAGGSWGAMLRAASDYAGEPHRMEFVRSVRGVDFFNDSKGTNVGATVAGLEGLGQLSILIAGGVGKGQDFRPLAEVIGRHVKHVVLIGEAAAAIRDTLASTNVVCEDASSMQDAVNKAYAQATEGEAVVLSPACASFDMFKNYPHRGQCFVEAVNEIALEQGELV